MIDQENWGDCPMEPLQMSTMDFGSDRNLRGIGKAIDRGEGQFWRKRGYSRPPEESTPRRQIQAQVAEAGAKARARLAGG